MKHLHGGRLSAAAAANNLEPEEILDFSANINFLGPPPILISAIRENAGKIANYPEINSSSLKKLIAERHGLQAEMVTVANGAAEMIYQLTKVLKPEKVMVIDPTFSEYELAAKSVGSEIEHFKLNSSAAFKFKIEDLLNSLNKEIELLFFCNPNNPTASLKKAAELEILIKKAAEKEITVVIDEAFVDFLDEVESYTTVNLLGKYKNLVILKSMTKIFAIPGLRLGYALSSKKLSLELEEKRDPWSVNYFSQLAGEIIFSGAEEIEEYLKISREKIAEERNYLYQKLSKIEKLKVYPPAANYIFIDISASAYRSSRLKKLLAEEAILIRNCDSYHGLQDDFIRVAVKDRESNNLLLEKLKNLLV